MKLQKSRQLGHENDMANSLYIKLGYLTKKRKLQFRVSMHREAGKELYVLLFNAPIAI